MMPFLLLSVWLAGHFIVWLLVLRARPFWRGEKAILLWHVGSCALVGLALLAWLLTGGHVAVGVGLIALHGIYSVSFLELWALAQGSYSLSILTRAVRCGRIDAGDFAALEQIGAAKQADRHGDLARLGLARRIDDHDWRLTPRGLRVSAAARALLALVRIERAG